MDPIFSQQIAMPAPKPKSGGMFGGNTGNILAAALAGFVSRQNPLPLQMLMQAQAQKQQGQREEQQYQRQRQDGREDYLWKQEHSPPPDPTQTDRYLGEFLDPNTDPNRKAALGQILFPPVMGQVNGSSAIIDRAAMLGGGGSQQMPAPPPGHIQDGYRFKGGNPGDPHAWEPVAGGPTPQASGGFPRSY